MSLLKVECSEFEVVLNCSAHPVFSDPLPVDVRLTCCDQYSKITPHSEPQQSLRAWYKCCDALVANDLAPMEPKEWDTSSYQAYVMGVAVFAILMCLFISGARSVRRRHTAARLRQRQLGLGNNGLNPNTRPEFNTQISLGPPSYGELEAGGLTNLYKSGGLNPPAYPGIAEETAAELACEGITIDADPARGTDEEKSGEVGQAEENKLEILPTDQTQEPQEDATIPPTNEEHTDEHTQPTSSQQEDV